MEIKMSSVYTKEAVMDLILLDMANQGYKVETKDIKFVQKRGRKSDFSRVLISNATPTPKVPKAKKEKKKEIEKKED